MESFGCSLPPGFKLPESSSDDDDSNGPPEKKTKLIGPHIPKHVALKGTSSDEFHECTEDTSENVAIGPVLPASRTRCDEEDEVYGPLPTDSKLDYNIVNIIEKRAANMKDRLHMKESHLPESAQREEWMTVPDTSRRNQLGAISRCLAPGSKNVKKETEIRNPEEDEKTTKELKKYNKSKRAESLLDMHQKKKKKDKKEKKLKEEKRKPFDRDEIAVRHFTEKQVNSVIDKAKYLNSRFAPSKTSQYL